MNHTTIDKDFLEQISYPAFLVRDKTIVAANQSAIKQNVSLNCVIFDIIHTGAAEYEQFSQGRLSVVLKIANIMYHAAVLKHDDCDLVIIEADFLTPELCMLEAAARSLREPLTAALLSMEALQNDREMQDNHALQSLNHQLHRLFNSVINMSDAATYNKQRTTKIEYCDITQKLNDIIKRARKLLKSAQRSLRFRKIGETYCGMIDGEKLERAILNVIATAINIGDPLSKLNAEFTKDKDHYRFSAAINTNIHDREKIDSMFFSCETTPQIFEDAQNGICNGLIIARNAVIAHDGTLMIDRPKLDVIRFTLSIAIQSRQANTLHSPVLLPTDYSGGYDHLLIAFSDILPDELF